MTRSELEQLARMNADAAGLDPALVCAVVEQESGWNPWAIRSEPAFYTRYIQPLVDRGEVREPTEAQSRAFSWGLMQMMGQVARERGFTGRFLSELCQPETGLKAGCEFLAYLLRRAEGDVARALLRWNGGGNPHYPQEVMGRMARYAA